MRDNNNPTKQHLEILANQINCLRKQKKEQKENPNAELTVSDRLKLEAAKMPVESKYNLTPSSFKLNENGILQKQIEELNFIRAER